MISGLNYDRADNVRMIMTAHYNGETRHIVHISEEEKGVNTTDKHENSRKTSQKTALSQKADAF